MNDPVEFRPTCDISDDHPDAAVVVLSFQSFGGRHEMAGAASTIACFEDNSRVREAVAEAGDGRVLVIDGGGSTRRSLVGGNVAAEAAANGWAGIIVNGAVRDRAELVVTDLAVHALGTVPRKTEKLGAGQRDVPVAFGGATVRPGDIVYADLDGVVVVQL